MREPLFSLAVSLVIGSIASFIVLAVLVIIGASDVWFWSMWTVMFVCVMLLLLVTTEQERRR